MTQEAVRMRTGEDDRADVRIAVCTIDQRFQLLGDLGIEQRMRASVDTSDKHPGVALDGNVSWGLRATSRRVHVVLRELAVVASPVSGAGRVTGLLSRRRILCAGGVKASAGGSRR